MEGHLPAEDFGAERKGVAGEVRASGVREDFKSEVSRVVKH
jgi:hypothetical protein